MLKNQTLTETREIGIFAGRFLFREIYARENVKTVIFWIFLPIAPSGFKTVLTAGWEFAAVALSVRKRVGYSRTACR